MLATREKGVILAIKENYAFLKCVSFLTASQPDGALIDEVFVHFDSLKRSGVDVANLKLGDEFLFDIARNERNGRPNAVNLSAIPRRSCAEASSKAGRIALFEVLSTARRGHLGQLRERPKGGGALASEEEEEEESRAMGVYTYAQNVNQKSLGSKFRPGDVVRGEIAAKDMTKKLPRGDLEPRTANPNLRNLELVFPREEMARVGRETSMSPLERWLYYGGLIKSSSDGGDVEKRTDAETADEDEGGETKRSAASAKKDEGIGGNRTTSRFSGLVSVVKEHYGFISCYAGESLYFNFRDVLPGLHATSLEAKTLRPGAHVSFERSLPTPTSEDGTPPNGNAVRATRVLLLSNSEPEGPIPLAQGVEGVVVTVRPTPRVRYDASPVLVPPESPDLWKRVFEGNSASEESARLGDSAVARALFSMYEEIRGSKHHQHVVAVRATKGVANSLRPGTKVRMTIELDPWTGTRIASSVEPLVSPGEDGREEETGVAEPSEEERGVIASVKNRFGFIRSASSADGPIFFHLDSSLADSSIKERIKPGDLVAFRRFAKRGGKSTGEGRSKTSAMGVRLLPSTTREGDADALGGGCIGDRPLASSSSAATKDEDLAAGVKSRDVGRVRGLVVTEARVSGRRRFHPDHHERALELIASQMIASPFSGTVTTDLSRPPPSPVVRVSRAVATAGEQATLSSSVPLDWRKEGEIVRKVREAKEAPVTVFTPHTAAEIAAMRKEATKLGLHSRVVKSDTLVIGTDIESVKTVSRGDDDDDDDDDDDEAREGGTEEAAARGENEEREQQQGEEEEEENGVENDDENKKKKTTIRKGETEKEFTKALRGWASGAIRGEAMCDILTGFVAPGRVSVHDDGDTLLVRVDQRDKETELLDIARSLALFAVKREESTVAIMRVVPSQEFARAVTGENVEDIRLVYTCLEPHGPRFLAEGDVVEFTPAQCIATGAMRAVNLKWIAASPARVQGIVEEELPLAGLGRYYPGGGGRGGYVRPVAPGSLSLCFEADDVVYAGRDGERTSLSVGDAVDFFLSGDNQRARLVRYLGEGVNATLAPKSSPPPTGSPPPPESISSRPRVNVEVLSSSKEGGGASAALQASKVVVAVGPTEREAEEGFTPERWKFTRPITKMSATAKEFVPGLLVVRE